MTRLSRVEETRGTKEEPLGRDAFLAATENRRLAYAWLSRAYEKEVTASLLREIVSGKSSVLNAEALSEVPDGELKRGLETLGEYLMALKQRDLEQARLELAVDYANLFLGVKRKVWHPSESAYTSKSHLVMQEPLDRVLQAYWDAGVDKEKEFTEPADHIAVELQFMAHLCGKSTEALREDRKDDARRYFMMQEDFLKKHLSLWIDLFAKDVEKNAETGFYRGVAVITQSFVELDGTMIGGFLKEIEGP